MSLFAYERPAAPERRPPRGRTFGRLIRFMLVLGLEAAAGFAVYTAVHAPEPAPADVPRSALDVATVAADPKRFRGGEVRVQGRTRPRPERVSTEDRRAFVLEGPRDSRLLVVPEKGANWPRYQPGLEVVVRGRVVIPPTSKRLANRVDSRTAVARRAQAVAIVKAQQVDLAP